jgi:4-amino-4-deoxy-L-arabinose transferase-like glycosyltransferase
MPCFPFPSSMNLTIPMETTQFREQKSSKPFSQWFWIGFALLTVSAMAIAACFWILAHPHPLGWDEAQYINRVQGDVWTLEHLGKREFLSVFFHQDVVRPPTYRILAMPTALLWNTHPFSLRLTSLFFWGVSLALVYLAGRSISGTTAGAFSVIVLTLSPSVISRCMTFFMEYSLFLGIGAMLYFLFRDWNRNARPYRWIGLGLALGWGLLSKVTFATIAVPMMLLAMILSGCKMIGSPSLRQLLSASGLGFLILAPWWSINFKGTIGYAGYASNFIREAAGPQGELGTLLNWVAILVQSCFGIPLALLSVAIVATFLVQLVRQKVQVNRSQWLALGVCCAGVFPLWVLSAWGSNYNPRLIGPSFFPLAIALGILASMTGWTTSRWLAPVAVVLLTFQLAVTIEPSFGTPRYKSESAIYQMAPWQNDATQRLLRLNPETVMLRRDVWDWSQFRELCRKYQYPQPKIAYLGNIDRINPPMLSFPWIQAGESVEVTELWRSESGQPIDWDNVMQVVDRSDAIVSQVVPETEKLDSVEALDSQYNNELIQQLQANPQFTGPIELTMGKVKPTPIVVFFRRS